MKYHGMVPASEWAAAVQLDSFFAATHSIEPGAYYFVIIRGLRYAEAYSRELDHFIGAIASGRTATRRRRRRRQGFGARRCRAGIISNGPRDRDLISRLRRAFPRERRPVGGNRAPACQKRFGKVWRRRGDGAVFRENCRSLRF
jgi:hypothetical protein